MKKVKNWLWAAVAATSMNLVFAKDGIAAPSNKELKIGISQEFENLNPTIKQMLATEYLFNLVGRPLTTMDANAKWVPVLIKEIPTLENKKAQIISVGGKKKVVATFEILEKAQWGDGHPLTCEDFDFARTVGLSPNVSTGDRETFSQFEKIEWEAATPKKCKITFEKARWDFYQIGTFYPMPKHIEEPIFKAHMNEKEGYERNSAYVKTPTNPGLYSGPYVVSEIKLGDHVTFTANPRFYGNPPKIQKIIVKLIPNTGTMEANLRSGTIDMISVLGLDMDQAIAFENKAKSENLPFDVHFVQSMTYEHIDVNLENPILKDLKVRKALTLAMDREDLVNSLYKGKLRTAVHLFSPRDPWFTDKPGEISLYKYSAREANKLLEESGWKLEKDGYRYKEGKKLSLELLTTQGNKTREMVQVILQRQMKQVGVELLPKTEQARVFFGETVKKRKFQGLAMFAWISAPESIPRSTVHSVSIPSEKNAWSGQNSTGWSNKNVDQAIDSLELEFNPKKRIELAHVISKEYTADLPVLPLYYRSDIAVTPKNLKNYKVSGHQFSDTNFVENWNLE